MNTLWVLDPHMDLFDRNWTGIGCEANHSHMPVFIFTLAYWFFDHFLAREIHIYHIMKMETLLTMIDQEQTFLQEWQPLVTIPHALRSLLY